MRRARSTISDKCSNTRMREFSNVSMNVDYMLFDIDCQKLAIFLKFRLVLVHTNIIVPLSHIKSTSFLKFNIVMKQMAPFGPENPKPVFEARNMFVSNSLSSFKERHLRFLASQEGNETVFSAVGFDMMEHYDRIANGDIFRMAFTLEENTFNGHTSLQLRIKDIKFD